MGQVTSDDLFCDKEQALFDFYELNRFRYRSAADIGANIGVHAIVMAKLGWHVTAFEPDPEHYRIMRKNVDNHCVMVGSTRAAVLDHEGEEIFIRVLNNTTGSHVVGLKDSYGPTDAFKVTTLDAANIFKWADFAKIDAEGAEAVILSRLTPDMECECMVEVGSLNNAKVIFDRFVSEGMPMYSQKTGWKQVFTLEDMPKHHSEGSLFIGDGSCAFPM